MTVYIDNDFKCYTTDDGTRRAVEAEFFNGKCSAFIEGYRYIPLGETWTNPQGVECSGVSPWKDYSILAAAQAQYETDLVEIQVRQAALAELGVTADD